MTGVNLHESSMELRHGNSESPSRDAVGLTARGERAQDFRSEAMQRCHEIDGSSSNRLFRHAEHDAGLFVLREIDGAGHLHFKHALRTVVAHAGQDDTDRFWSHRHSDRAEEYIDAGTVS